MAKLSARWAYEALAVYQYKNKYEHDLYPYDKVLSTATYKKDYWIKSLKNKVSYIKRNANDSTKRAEIQKAIKLINNEIKKELATNKYISSPYSIDLMLVETFDSTIIAQTETYLDNLSIYYINLYNKTNHRKDNMIQHFEDSLGKEYVAMREAYTNRSLTEFVRNTNSIDRIIEYKNSLHQKIDPIYKDPENSFIKAHFYAPYKKVFGQFYPTYIVNIIVLLIINIILFVILYFRGVHRTLTWFGKMNEKIRKKLILKS